MRIEEVRSKVNMVHSLAVSFYLRMGYVHDSKKHKPLYDSQHPTEEMVWEMACYAYREIDGLDGEEYLEILREMESE